MCKQEQSLFPSTPARTSFEQIVQTWNLASCPVKYKLARAIGTCHLPTGIKSRALAVADFQHPWKGISGGKQKWGRLCAGKTGRASLQKVSCCQEPILRTQMFFYLLIARKAWKPFMVTTASCDCKKPSRHWQNTSTKNRHMIACIAPSPKSHISLCVSLEQVLRAIWGAVSWATVLLLPPKHLTCNFRVVHFWKSAPWTYLFIHSSPNSFPTCLQWDSHEDKSRPRNARRRALTLYSPGAWKHPLWATRLHPFTAGCTRSKYHRQTWSHILTMEKATEQKVPMSLNHPLNESKPEGSPDPEGLHCALQRRKDKFLWWWKSTQFILYLYST